MASEKLEMILAKLKDKFGDKQILSQKDIAPYIGKSVNALTKLRNRGRFPIPIIQIGGKFYVSMQDFAVLLAGEFNPIIAPTARKKNSHGEKQVPWGDML